MVKTKRAPVPLQFDNLEEEDAMDGWMNLELFFGILMLLGGFMGRSEFPSSLAKRFFTVVAIAGLVIVVWVIAMCSGMTGGMRT